MVHGGISPSLIAFDLQHKSYSWMDHLARAGFDVYAMDMTGYGRSARPQLDDPGNVAPAQREALGLPPSTAPSYPFELVTSQSEWDEIDRVVDFIRARRGVEKISLVGWSGGGKRTGSYTSRHVEKIARLVIFAASNYASDGRDAPPDPLPQPGLPMVVQTRRVAEEKRWNPYLRCDGQIEPEMKEIIWRNSMASDPVGAAWGPGVMRAPVRTYWGWNRQAAQRIDIPVLIMIGVYDDLLPSNRALYADLATPNKMMLEIDCGSHFMVWETQHRILHEGSRSFLAGGGFRGETRGRFVIDHAGAMRPA
jgi:pimeloyl-ACP methyl ester carboxylesterase